MSIPDNQPRQTARLGALAQPLPAGMRDLLPESADEQLRLTRTVIDTFCLFGYRPVSLPTFEYAEVIQQGLADSDGDQLLRFVEPETGEVVALRPDMTPQVARLVSARLASAPEPIRICYEGSVLRRRRERARNDRQVPQAGVELVGALAQRGDLEVLHVAVTAARATGLERFVVDLSHPGLVAALLEGTPPSARAPLIEALSLKDATALRQRAQAAGLRGAARDALQALPRLHGGPEVWDEAEAVLARTAARDALSQLRALHAALLERVPGIQVSVDLGETSRFNYYTGPAFQLLAEGPGVPIGAGGRYDALYERFGTPRPAAGFALDLDNLRWALKASGRRTPMDARVLVRGPEQATLGLLDALRNRGVPCAPAPSEGMRYARAWLYSLLVTIEDEGMTVTDVESGAQERFEAPAPHEDPAPFVERIARLAYKEVTVCPAS